MFVERFMTWCACACVEDRVDAVEELARHYVSGLIAVEEMAETEQVFTLLLSDPSPRVRHQLAVSLSESDAAPRSIIWGLTQEVAETACVVYRNSPALSARDLVHAVRRNIAPIQLAIASRQRLDAEVARALCEHGDALSVTALLDNPSVVISPALRHTIAERLGDDPMVRTVLQGMDDILPATRQMLAKHLASALFSLTDEKGWGRTADMEAATTDACNRATLGIVGEAGDVDLVSYVTHLRETGQLTTAILLRAICCGHGAFFEVALSQLSGVSLKRVESIIDEGRKPAFRALYDKCGLPLSAFSTFSAAVDVWQTADEGEDILERIIDRVESDPASDGALLAMLGRIWSETSRQRAQNYDRLMLLEAA